MLKKLSLILVSVALGATAVWTQTNVAQGKRVSKIEDEFKSTTVVNADLQWLTDGQTGTAVNLYDATEKKVVPFSIDLVKEYHLGTISISWEGACGSDYTVKTGTADANGNITWGDAIVTQTGLQGGAGANQTVSYNVDATTRYLRFDCTKAFEAAWGVKMFEFYAYTYAEQKLASVSLNHDVLKWAENVNLVASPKTSIGADFTGKVTYSVSPSTATLTADGNNLTLKAPEAGVYTITATDGTKSFSVPVGLVGAAANDPTELPVNVINIFSDKYDATGEPGLSDPAWNWKYDSKEMIDFDGNRAYLVSRVGTFGLNANSADVSTYDTFHAAIYVAKNLNGYIQMEGANFKQTFGLIGGQWNYVNINIKGAITNPAIWLQFYLGGSSTDNQRDAIFDNIYFSREPVADSIAPVLTKAELKSVGATKAILTLNGTDDVATKLTYIVTDENGTQYTGAGEAGTDFSLTIKGLAPNTQHTLSVIAQDYNLNNSEAKTIALTTNEFPKAPVPTQKETNVKSIYSNAYNPAEGVSPSWDTWGSVNEVIAPYTGNGDECMQLSNFGYGGINFRTNVAPMDVSDMDTLHIDFFAEDSTRIFYTPILAENLGGRNQVITLKGGEWTSVDLDLAKFKQQMYVDSLSNVIQISFTNGNSKDDLWIDNIYFYKADTTVTGVISTVVPSQNAVGNIYSIDGRLVRTNATSFEGLPQGIYIKNHQKVIVK